MIDWSKYLGAQLLAIMPLDAEGRIDFSRLTLTGAFSLGWQWLLYQAFPAYQKLSTFVPSLTAVLLVWALDMIAGTWASMVCGDRDPATKELRTGPDGKILYGWRALNPARAKAGIGKLCLWAATLSVTAALRLSHQPAPIMLAGLVESYILLADAGSFLRNAGRIGRRRGLQAAGELAEGRADGLFGR